MGQSPVKSSQNDHCFFLFSPMPVTSPCRDRPLATPCVAHAGDPRSSCCAVLIPCMSLIHFPSPLLLRRAHAEPNRAELVAGPCAGCSSPRLLISLRPKLRSLTLHLLCPSTSSIKPFCGRIEPAIAGRHCQPRRSSAPLVDLPSPATLLWLNHLNYPGSSALPITLKATPAETHFKQNNSWSVG